MNSRRKTYVLIAAIIFIIVFLLTNHFTREISQEEYDYCKQIAADIYEQRDEFLIEVPEDVTVSKTDTEITVGLKGVRLGKIVAFIEDDKLVFEKDSQAVGSFFISMALGALAVLIYCLFLIIKLEKRYGRG